MYQRQGRLFAAAAVLIRCRLVLKQRILTVVDLALRMLFEELCEVIHHFNAKVMIFETKFMIFDTKFIILNTFARFFDIGAFQPWITM